MEPNLRVSPIHTSSTRPYDRSHIKLILYSYRKENCIVRHVRVRVSLSSTQTYFLLIKKCGHGRAAVTLSLRLGLSSHDLPTVQSLCLLEWFRNLLSERSSTERGPTHRVVKILDTFFYILYLDNFWSILYLYWIHLNI